MHNSPLKLPSKPPPGRPKSSQQKNMTLHPPLASLARLPNGDLRVPSPLARYATMRSRASSVLDYVPSKDYEESNSSPQRSLSTSPQYLVSAEVIRSSILAAQKSFQSRVRTKEWVPDGSKENIPREFLEITQQHKSPNSVFNEAMLDPLARDRVINLRATLEQLFFKLQNVEKLQEDPVFGPDTGVDIELGECNAPIEDISKFTTGLFLPEDSNHKGDNVDANSDTNINDNADPTTFTLSKHANNSQLLHSDDFQVLQPSKLFSQEIISQDHDGEMNDFLLGDACKIGNLLEPLPSVELDKQIVSFSDKQGLSEMDILNLAFDTCIDYLSSCNKNGQITEILQTLTRVKDYYLKRITSTPTQLTAYQEAATILDTKLQVTVKDLKEATHENQELKIKLATLKSNYEDAVKRIDELVCQTTMQTRDIGIVTRRFNVAQDQVNQLSFTLDVLKSELLDERNKTKRLAATANRFKSNLERVGDRAAQAERKANYGELQILDLEKQKKTMMAEMAMLQEQLSTITGAFAKERSALISENERLTMENNDFQTTLATGGLFFSSGADESEANSEVLVRVANKIHKRTDMSPHAKLAATTILRLCAEDARIACRRLGITNDGLSSIMWLVTAAKNSDNVSTFLTHLHGQYSSYFVAKGTAIQTKDSYMMDVKFTKKKKAVDTTIDKSKTIQSTNPNEEISISVDNKIYTSFDDEFSDQHGLSMKFLLKMSQTVLANMHKQLQIYRNKYEHLSTDSDQEFEKLQTLFDKYSKKMELHSINSSMELDNYQKSFYEDGTPIDRDFTIDNINQSSIQKGADILVDNSNTNDSCIYDGSGESSTRYLGTKRVSTQAKNIVHDNNAIPLTQGAKINTLHNDKTDLHVTIPIDSSPQQHENALQNISMESIDFGGHYVSSQLIDESIELFIESDHQGDNLKVNIVDIPEDVIKVTNTKIATIASLSTNQTQKDTITSLLQHLVYKSKYNYPIMQLFNEYADRVIQDNEKLKELILQQRSDPENGTTTQTEKINASEAAAAIETEKGIEKLCQVLDNLFNEEKTISDESSKKDNPQDDIEVVLNGDLSACTKETINWVVEQVKPKIECIRRKKAIKHKATTNLIGVDKKPPYTKHHEVLQSRKPLPSACTTSQQRQTEVVLKDQLEKANEGINSSLESKKQCGDQVPLEVVNEIDASEDKQGDCLYYKGTTGELCTIKYSVIHTNNNLSLNKPQTSGVPGVERSMILQGSPLPSSSPVVLLSPSSHSVQHRPSSKSSPIPGASTPLAGNIIDLNTMVLDYTSPAMDVSNSLPIMLMQSKRIGSPARNANSRQNSSRPKSDSLSRRHFYGLSTHDILARVSKNISSEYLATNRSLTSPQQPGYSEEHMTKLESKFILQNADGAIRFIDASTIKKDASEEVASIIQKNNQSSPNEIYYVEGNNTGMLLVTLTPDAIPESLNSVIEKQETILINDRQGRIDREQIPVTIMSINGSLSAPAPSIEAMDNTVTMVVAHPLPQDLAKSIKEATKTTTVAIQTTPMLLDEMISTGDLLVNDAFIVIERLFTAMYANPLQMDKSLVETVDSGIHVDSAHINNDDAIGLTMSQFNSIPLFHDVYINEQLYAKNESQTTTCEGGDEAAKSSDRNEKPTALISPLLSILQRNLPDSMPLATSGLLGPSGIVKYGDNNLPDRPAFLHPGKTYKEEKGLEELSLTYDRPKTAINLADPVSTYKQATDNLLPNISDYREIYTVEKSNNINSNSILNQSDTHNKINSHDSIMQKINTSMQYDHEDMALSAENNDIIDNNSRTYNEAVLDLLNMTQKHKPYDERVKQGTNINNSLSKSLKCEDNITDGSLVIESLTPEKAKEGPVLLRKQQQRPSLYSTDLEKSVFNHTPTTDHTVLHNRRLENKILGHNARNHLQPQLLSTTFVKTMHCNSSHQENVVPYKGYLNIHGQESIPSSVTSATYSTRPCIQLHPRHGNNALFTQCNPLEPPEGSLLQFVGGPFAALVTKFGSFKQYRHIYPHELLEIVRTCSEGSQLIYPCILSAHTDILNDFSSKSLTDEENLLQGKHHSNNHKMKKTFKYMIESINQLSSITTTTGENPVKANGLLTDGLRVVAKQFSNMKLLIPKPGDTVLYIRNSALTIRNSESKPILPTILQLLQEISPHRCEIFTIESGCTIDTIHRTYIKIPINNAYLKSSAWTLKLIRDIYNSRLNIDESYVVLKEPVEHVLTVFLPNNDQPESKNNSGNDINDKSNVLYSSSQNRFFNFGTIHGSLSRQEAESLPHFLLYYAKNKYGVNNIVAPLLWSLIISVCYHQYDNAEIYLFARFLFGDLDFDFYLTYLDIQRVLGGVHRDEIDLSEIPEILHTILPNWSGKRRYSLCESIYSCNFVQHNKQRSTLSNMHLSQMILIAYGGYRRPIFESLTLVWSKITAENFLTEASFRELCDTCLTLLNFNSVTEAFYAFSVEYNSDATTIVQPENQSETSTAAAATENGVLIDTVHNLVHRRMYYDNFIDFFLSYCLGRYTIISRLTLDEAMRGTHAKRNIQMASKVYERLVALSQDIATKKLSSAEIEESQSQKQELIKVIRKVFNHLNLASCDISAYDSQRAIDNMRQGINLLTDFCIDAKSEAASIVLGGGVAALSAFIARNC